MYGCDSNKYRFQPIRNNRDIPSVFDLDKPGTKTGKLAITKGKQAGPRRQWGSIGVVSSRDFGIAEDACSYPRAFEILMAIKNYAGIFDRRKEENRQKRIDTNRKKRLQREMEEKLKNLWETQQFLRSVK